MDFKLRSGWSHRYTLYSDDQIPEDSYRDFQHPEPDERRKIWRQLTQESNHTPEPYLPTQSQTRISRWDVFHFKGHPTPFSQIERLCAFESKENEIAVSDGYSGKVLEWGNDGLSLKEESKLHFLDGWQETERGIIGVKEDETVKLWPQGEPKEMPPTLFPESYRYIADSTYIHNSLTYVTGDDSMEDEWITNRRRDMRDGRSAILQYTKDTSFTIMDAALPERQFRVFRPNSDLSFWSRTDFIEPQAEFEGDTTDPYKKFIERLYHIPLFVCGHFYEKWGMSMCVGASRRDSCMELFAVTKDAIWSRLTNWSQPNVERKMVSANKIISFDFQPEMGWCVKDVRVSLE